MDQQRQPLIGVGGLFHKIVEEKNNFLSFIRRIINFNLSPSSISDIFTELYGYEEEIVLAGRGGDGFGDFLNFYLVNFIFTKKKLFSK